MGTQQSKHDRGNAEEPINIAIFNIADRGCNSTNATLAIPFLLFIRFDKLVEVVSDFCRKFLVTKVLE